MEATKAKRVIKIFWAWQEEKEEEWLASMSREGWHLIRVGFLNYTFKKGKPYDYIYRFDFKVATNEDTKEYVSFFEDTGWKLIHRFGSWFYFRADRALGPDQEIYNNNRSKIEKYKRLLIFLVIIIGPSVCFVLPNMYMRVIDMSEGSILNNSAALNLYLVFLVIITIIDLWVVYGIVRISIILKKLSQDITE